MHNEYGIQDLTEPPQYKEKQTILPHPIHGDGDKKSLTPAKRTHDGKVKKLEKKEIEMKEIEKSTEKQKSEASGKIDMRKLIVDKTITKHIHKHHKKDRESNGSSHHKHHSSSTSSSSKHNSDCTPRSRSKSKSRSHSSSDHHRTHHKSSSKQSSETSLKKSSNTSSSSLPIVITDDKIKSNNDIQSSKNKENEMKITNNVEKIENPDRLFERIEPSLIVEVETTPNGEIKAMQIEQQPPPLPSQLTAQAIIVNQQPTLPPPPLQQQQPPLPPTPVKDVMVLPPLPPLPATEVMVTPIKILNPVLPTIISTPTTSQVAPDVLQLKQNPPTVAAIAPAQTISTPKTKKVPSSSSSNNLSATKSSSSKSSASDLLSSIMASMDNTQY